jgi:hypothetical protein
MYSYKFATNSKYHFKYLLLLLFLSQWLDAWTTFRNSRVKFVFTSTFKFSYVSSFPDSMCMSSPIYLRIFYMATTFTVFSPFLTLIGLLKFLPAVIWKIPDVQRLIFHLQHLNHKTVPIHNRILNLNSLFPSIVWTKYTSSEQEC